MYDDDRLSWVLSGTRWTSHPESCSNLRSEERVNPFLMREDGSTEPMPRIRCADECAELQAALVKNPYLLPGDQIDPDDPRRWLLVKREMPVPDPTSGTGRWSV